MRTLTVRHSRHSYLIRLRTCAHAPSNSHYILHWNVAWNLSWKSTDEVRAFDLKLVLSASVNFFYACAIRFVGDHKLNRSVFNAS